MAQQIQPPSGSIRGEELHSKINRLLSAANGTSLKFAFLHDVWPRLEEDYYLMVRNLIAHCENLVRERNISAKVDGRAKAVESIDKTLDRRLRHRIANHLGEYKSVEEMFHDMHDLAGIGIVVDYPSQLEPANQLIEEAFQQVKSPNVFKKERPVGKEWDAWFGAYQSYNHHVSVKKGTQGTLRAYRNVVFEVQLTSLPESLYNKLAHPLLYKQQAGAISRRDEMVIDLSHGLALCYSICLLYAQDKLGDNAQLDQGLMSAMRSAANDASDGQVENMSPLLSMMPDTVKAQSVSGPEQEPGSKVSRKLLTSTLSVLPEQCPPGQLWTGFVERMKGWNAKLEAVETAVKDQTEAFQQYHQDDDDKKCLVDLRIINPSTNKKAIENAKGGLLKGAYEWILGHPEYQRFRNDNTNRLLWVKGDPGKGKTMLLCGIINHLEYESSTSVSYFFCEATQNNSLRCATAVLRTLIWRLCTSQPHLVSHVRKKYDTEGKDSFEGSTALFTLEEIMADILQDPSCSTITLVIDALDECTEDTMPDLIRLIINFSNSFEAKWIVSSRNWPMIQEQFRSAEKVTVSLELNKHSVSHAVDLFIRHKVAELARLKGYDTVTKAGIFDVLRRKANDTFLWVALVCAELSKVRSFNAMQLLNSIPAGLEKLYARMLERVLSSINSTLCKQLLATASIAVRPLSFIELPAFIHEAKSFSNRQIEELIGECGSFLSARDSYVYFVHQSAQDFLFGHERGVFQSTIQGHHLQIFRSSMAAMQTLERNFSGLSSPGELVNEIRSNKSSRFYSIEYCCLYWVDHLKLASHERQTQDDNIVCEFFKTKVLYWVEALCFNGHATEGIIAVQKLRSIANSDELKDLSKDLHRFWLTFKEVLDVAPLQLYCSALLFAPTSSLIKNLHENSRYPWATMKQSLSQDPSEKWGACISTLEAKNLRSFALSMDGHHLVYGHGRRGERSGVRLWDSRSNGCKHSVSTSHDIRSVAISFDGRHVAVALIGDYSKGMIELRDSDLSLSDTQLEKGDVSACSIAFSPDGRQIAAGLFTGFVRIWDLATGAVLQTLGKEGSGTASSIAYSADGKQLAVTALNTKIWDLASGKYLFSANTNTVGAVFLPGSKLATARYSQIQIWDTENGLCLEAWPSETSLVLAIASLDLPGLLLASALENGSVKIWDQAGNCVQSLLGHGKPVRSLSFSSEQGIAASASGDETIRLWDIATVADGLRNAPRHDDPMKQDSQSHSSQVRAVEFSPDGKRLASTAADETVKIWDIASFACIRTLTSKFPLKDHIALLQFSPDGRWLLRKPERNEYPPSNTIWDLTSLESTQTVSFNDGKKNDGSQLVRGLSPDGRLVALSKRGVTCLMDMETEEMLQHFQFKVRTQTLSLDSLVLAQTFSSDSRIMVLASRILACAYKISTGEELWSVVINGREGSSNIALSQDSTQFVMLSDQGLCVWKVDTLPPKRLFRFSCAKIKGPYAMNEGKLAINRRWLVWCEPSSINIYDLENLTHQHMRNTSLITSVSFDTSDENCFHTNAGSWTIDKKGYVKSVGYGFSADGAWITRDSKRLLWLPPQYRGASARVRGETVALGSASGSVAVLHFGM